MLLLQGDPYPELLRTCKREAFHLEVLDSYGVAVESEPLRRFLAGRRRLISNGDFAGCNVR
ncbi:DUF6879 family protein [Nocardia cyriacigeorgica]|uniref:DUF6879 family protein n=1 Tax=Nocardia cyriacigeorgica TaxID=135487 RepID=UPI0032B00E26